MSNYLDSARIAERYCERALVPSAPWYPGALERLVVSICPELPRLPSPISGCIFELFLINN